MKPKGKTCQQWGSAEKESRARDQREAGLSLEARETQLTGCDGREAWCTSYSSFLCEFSEENSVPSKQTIPDENLSVLCPVNKCGM